MKANLPTSRRWSVTVLLMLVLVACYVAQEIVVVRMEKPYDSYLALSGYGMKSWHLWELFTYQFFHLGLIHLAINLAGLWLLARPFEREHGTKRFLQFYIGAVLAGGLLQGATALAGFLLPESQETIAAFLRDRFGGPVYGSSVGLCALLVARLICSDTKIARTPLKTGHLAWVALAIAAALAFMRWDPAVPQLGYVGGVLFAIIFARRSRCPSARSSAVSETVEMTGK